MLQKLLSFFLFLSPTSFPLEWTIVSGDDDRDERKGMVIAVSLAPQVRLSDLSSIFHVCPFSCYLPFKYCSPFFVGSNGLSGLPSLGPLLFH